MIKSGFMGMVLNNVLHFPDLWVSFFIKLHLLVSCSGIFGFMGMIFRKFLRIYGWHFYYLNGTAPYFGNSSNPLGGKYLVYITGIRWLNFRTLIRKECIDYPFVKT